MIHSTEQDHEQQPSAPQTVRFGFQGEPGAFGEEAVRSYCSHDSTITPEPLPYRNFADVFRAVATGEVEYGMVPVENSQAGSINEVYDLLRQHDLFVVGEIGHPVNHCLLCLPANRLAILHASFRIRRRWPRAMCSCAT